MYPLENPFHDHESIQAIFSFKRFKSSRSNGLHPSFYKKHLEIVGIFVLETCHSIFKNVIIPLNFNTTYLCLIQKIPNANHLNNFRPIVMQYYL